MRPVSKRIRYYALALLFLCTAAYPVAIRQAETATAATFSAPPQYVKLTVEPPLVDVGDAINFTLSARSWGSSVRVTISFLSAHHGFTGSMQWVPGCGCFRTAVALARRIHGIEQAKVRALVSYQGGQVVLNSNFSVRGLAPNGKDYAPGGTPFLTAWVSDSSPTAHEYQHFCAWVKTPDGLGVVNVPIRWSVHYRDHTENWNGGRTGANGLRCSSRSVSAGQKGFAVTADAYAGALHVRTYFTPSG